METVTPTEFTTNTDSLRVRCPHCNKLYLVQRNDIRETKPRFECVQCHDRFWISAEELSATNEIIGLPITQREPPKPQKVEPCPKCQSPVSILAADCKNCGIVISKWKMARVEKPSVPHTENQAKLWQKVIDSFNKPMVHDEFINTCRREKNLLYASYQYASLKKVLPSDEMILKRLSEIEALALLELPIASNKRWLMIPRVSQIPMMIGFVLLVVGLAIPMFRNVAGLGAVILFLSLAFRLQIFNRR